jgi:hypothetical protein
MNASQIQTVKTLIINQQLKALQSHLDLWLSMQSFNLRLLFMTKALLLSTRHLKIKESLSGICKVNIRPPLKRIKHLIVLLLIKIKLQ